MSGNHDDSTKQHTAEEYREALLGIGRAIRNLQPAMDVTEGDRGLEGDFASIADGQWHTFLVESDADGQRIYIDGDRDRQLERAIAAEEDEVAP